MFLFTNNSTNTTVSPENLQQLKEQLATILKSTNQTEKEIVVFLRNAEKDKSDYIFHTNTLRQRRQQLIDLIEDFYYDPSDKNEVMHKLNFNTNTDLFPFSCKINVNNNNNNNNCTNTTNTSQYPQAQQQTQKELTELDKAKEALQQKELERSRVARRAADDRARSSCARASSEEMAITLTKETEACMDTVLFLKTLLQKIKREIDRILVVAEQDKLSALSYSSQIYHFKKHIEALKSLQEHPQISPSMNSPNFNRLHTSLARLDSHEDLSMLMSTSPGSSDGEPESKRQSPITTIYLQDLPDPQHFGTKTRLGKEARYIAEDIQKAKVELDRVTLLASAETSRTLHLKDIMDDLQYGVVGFVKAADDAVGRKAMEVKQKQYYIDRIAQRAERDRIASAKLRNQINKAIQQIQEEQPGIVIKKSRRNEFMVEDAYLSQFVELGDLGKENTDPEMSASLPLSIAKSFHCPIVDIMSTTSPTVHMAEGAPEGLFVRRMQDLDILTKELQKKDEQLERIRKLAEAERNRHILWKDKFQELQIEYGTSPIISRTL